MKPQAQTLKKSLSEEQVPSVPLASEPVFTGLARSVECFDNHGFRNFRIVTLHLENGRVVKTEYSDPYASFEVISRMEMANEMAIHHLNNTWKQGGTLSR